MLLYPNGCPKTIGETEHQSLWKQTHVLSELPEVFFSEKEQRLIQKLISEDKWVIEESNDLTYMFIENGFAVEV